MRKSVKYTIKTVNSIGLIKDRIKEIVVSLYEEGERDFVVLGRSDFALLIEIVFKEMGLNDYRMIYLDEIPLEGMDGVILICKEGIQGGERLRNKTVDVIYELAKEDLYVNYNGE